MEVIDIQAVKDCLAEVSDCEDKQYAIALLEWAIGKRTFDLVEHDKKLLDKVAYKLKAEVNICKNCMIVDCNTEYFRPMCEKADKGFIVAEVEEIVDIVIPEIKSEIEE